MSYVKQLEELAGLNSSVVSNWAKDVLELDLSYKANKISESEYKELLQDLVYSNNISGAAVELETKTKLNECMENLISVAGIVL